MIDNGHIIGNHTVNHKSMPDLTDEQIKSEVMNLHTTIYEKYGYEMKYIRPPKGEYSERTVNFTNTLGYKTVMWSLHMMIGTKRNKEERNMQKKNT